MINAYLLHYLLFLFPNCGQVQKVCVCIVEFLCGVVFAFKSHRCTKLTEFSLWITFKHVGKVIEVMFFDFWF